MLEQKKRELKVIYQCYRGSLYNLTPSTQKLCNIKNVLLNANDLHDFDFEDYKRQTGQPGTHLLHLQDYHCYLSNFKCNTSTTLRHNPPDTVKLSLANGYTIYNKQQYIQMASYLGVDTVVTLGDDPVSFNQQVSKKRQVMPVVVGGVDNHFVQALHHQLQTLVHPPFAFIFLGFNQGQLLNKQPLPLIQLAQAIQIIQQQLDNHQEFIIITQGSIKEMLLAILLGVHSHVTEYPFVLAKQAKVLQLDFKTPLAALKSNQQQEQQKQEQQKQEQEKEQGKKKEQEKQSNYDMNREVIDEIINKDEKQQRLLDDIHEKSEQSLCEKCECFTCQQHSRMYIHHLLKCGEMTAQVLLTIHNCHQISTMFTYINQYGFSYIPHFVSANLL